MRERLFLAILLLGAGGLLLSNLKENSVISQTSESVISQILHEETDESQTANMDSIISNHVSHIVVNPTDMQWTEGPLFLPSGARVAVLEGDPSRSGLFTIRLEIPAGYRIPANWLFTNATITVISGSFSIGLGDVFDEFELKELPTGGFTMIGAGTRHFT